VGAVRRALLFGCLLVTAVACWAESPRSASAPQTVEIITSTGIRVFVVEMAATEAEVTKGLKGRTELPEGTGMLFDFRAEVQANMSMKDTPVALDMIFIRGNGQISRIVENLQPMLDRQIYSGGPVRGVLEVPAGTARRFGIAVGDRVAHRIFTSR